MIDYIYKKFEENNYSFHTDKNSYNLNIFAVRTNSKLSGMFDDQFYVVYRDHNQKWKIHQWNCITNVIRFHDDSNMFFGNKLLSPGQYKDTYKIDNHIGLKVNPDDSEKPLDGRNQMAFCQRLKRVSYTDLDDVENMHKEGFIGANVHSDKVLGTPEDLWKSWCIVFARAFDYADFMKLCHIHREMYGNSFTFTLFTEEQFDLVCS